MPSIQYDTQFNKILHISTQNTNVVFAPALPRVTGLLKQQNNLGSERKIRKQVLGFRA
jgi:hypothetical protein